jgi:hypothetical protein
MVSESSTSGMSVDSGVAVEAQALNRSMATTIRRLIAISNFLFMIFSVPFVDNRWLVKNAKADC